MKAATEGSSTWPRVKLGDVVSISTGKLDANVGTPDGAYPFFTCAETPLRIATFAFDTEAVLLAGNGNFNVKKYSGRFNAYQRTYVLEPKGIDLDFIYYAVLNYLPVITGQNRGSTIRYLRLSDIRDTEIGLPSPSEQRHIVARLDSLLARTKRAREEVVRIPRLIERYKQALLKAAHIQAEENAVERTDLGALALEVRNGVSRKPENAPPGLPILKISAVRSMLVRMDERRYYVPTAEEEVSRYNLHDGDLLFTRYNGNPELVANCGVVGSLEEDVIYPDKLIRVRVDRDRVKPSFVEAIAAAPQSRAALGPFIKSAAGQHGTSGADLKRLPIPLPSLRCQNEIPSRFKTASSAIDNLLQEAEKAALLLDRLDQATLQKAFSGELPCSES